jgi:hypothetical protein
MINTKRSINSTSFSNDAQNTKVLEDSIVLKTWAFQQIPTKVLDSQFYGKVSKHLSLDQTLKSIIDNDSGLGVIGG